MLYKYKMETLDLFTIPLYRFVNAAHNTIKPKMMAYLNNDEIYKDQSFEGTLDFTTPNLHKMTDFFSLRDFIMSSLEQVMEDLGHAPNSCQLTGMWGTRHKNGIGHHRHLHKNSFIAGIYYLNGVAGHSGTTFYRGYYHGQQLTPAMAEGRRLKINATWTHPFTEGTLIIFPSWLEHQTQSNNLQSPRNIISFNTLPLGPSNHDLFDRFNFLDASNAPMISKKYELYDYHGSEKPSPPAPPEPPRIDTSKFNL
jgi:uncharacterized protein (TIGR02466 family)